MPVVRWTTMVTVSEVTPPGEVSLTSSSLNHGLLEETTPVAERPPLPVGVGVGVGVGVRDGVGVGVAVGVPVGVLVGDIDGVGLVDPPSAVSTELNAGLGCRFES